MLSSSATYGAALAGPHKRRTIIDSYDALGNVLARDIPFESGAVSANLTRRVTRTANIRFPAEWWPEDHTYPLAPERAILRIRSGIEYPSGLYEVLPVFVGRVQEPTRNEDGTVSLTAQDRAADVVAARFENPRRATRPTILDQIETLIGEEVDGATFGPHDVADAPTPQLTWDEDRGQALDDLAAALGGRWFQLGDGSFVVRSYAYDDGTPVADYRDGPGGLVSRARVSRSRQGVASAFTVVSERFDGTNPVRVTARNTVSGSPTEYGPLFGRPTQVQKVQTPQTASEATRTARAGLNSSTALTNQWQTVMVADHRLECGDTVRLSYRGLTSVQIVDSITYPLDLGDMRVVSRAFAQPPTTL